MVAAAEAEAKKQNVEVTICIVDESGNLLFLEKADAARSTRFNSPSEKRATLPSTGPRQRTVPTQ